jgi:hypothetical protein
VTTTANEGGSFIYGRLLWQKVSLATWPAADAAGAPVVDAILGRA